MIQIPVASRLIGRLHALAKDRRANVAVELALAMPALCMFIFGIIEVGYALWMQNALDYSVASAARCASLTNTNVNNSTSPCSGGLTAYAASQSGATIDATAFTYNCRSTDACTNKTVTCGCQVTGSFTISDLGIPWLTLPVTLTSNACFLPPPLKACPNLT